MEQIVLSALTGIVIGGAVGFFIGGHNARVAASIVSAAHTAAGAAATTAAAVTSAAKTL